MTQALLAVNAMLLVAQGILLSQGEDLGLTEPVRILVNGAISVALAGIGVYLPTVSATLRRVMELRRR